MPKFVATVCGDSGSTRCITKSLRDSMAVIVTMIEPYKGDISVWVEDPSGRTVYKAARVNGAWTISGRARGVAKPRPVRINCGQVGQA